MNDPQSKLINFLLIYLKNEQRTKPSRIEYYSASLSPTSARWKKVHLENQSSYIGSRNSLPTRSLSIIMISSKMKKPPHFFQLRSARSLRKLNGNIIKAPITVALISLLTISNQKGIIHLINICHFSISQLVQLLSLEAFSAHFNNKEISQIHQSLISQSYPSKSSILSW